MTTEHVNVPRELLEKWRNKLSECSSLGASASECMSISMRMSAILSRATPSDESAELNYAKSLATSMWERHYAQEAPQWELCDNLYGVLSQIDNMLTGLMLDKPIAPRVVTADDARKVADDYFRLCKEADRMPMAHGMWTEQLQESLQSFATSLPAARVEGWERGKFSYTQLFNAIGAAVEWREHKTLGISVAKFEESMSTTPSHHGGSDTTSTPQ